MLYPQDQQEICCDWLDGYIRNRTSHWKYCSCFLEKFHKFFLKHRMGQEFTGIIFIYLLIKISFFFESLKKSFFPVESNLSWRVHFLMNQLYQTCWKVQYKLVWIPLLLNANCHTQVQCSQSVTCSVWVFFVFQRGHFCYFHSCSCWKRHLQLALSLSLGFK